MNNYIHVDYSASTVSAILVLNNEEPQSIITACEGNDDFSYLVEMIDEACRYLSGTIERREIHPGDVYEILTNASVDVTYDTLGAEELFLALKLNPTEFISRSKLIKS